MYDNNFMLCNHFIAQTVSYQAAPSGQTSEIAIWSFQQAICESQRTIVIMNWGHMHNHGFHFFHFL